MPFSCEHIFILDNSKSLDDARIRRTKGSGDNLVSGVRIPDLISVVWSIEKKDENDALLPQSLHFPLSIWQEESAKKWLEENKLLGKFEPAGKEDSSSTISVFRVDRVSKQIGSVKRTDEGYLTGAAPIAKVGIMSYMLSDGSIRRELVPPETLFCQDSMNTLKMKPVTDSHPAERKVDAKNASRRKVGFTGENIKQDGDFLVSSLTVTDESAVKNIEAGKQELSPGYHCDVLLQSGTFNGASYDAIQTKRVYNHVALCDAARGGPDIRLHLDSASANEIDGYEIEEIKLDNKESSDDSNKNNQPSKRSRFMSTIKLDGIEYTADQQVLNQLERANAQLVEKNAALDKVQANLDSVTSERDTLKARDFFAEVKLAAASRVSLERQASAHLDVATVEKIDTLTDTDIKTAVIVKAFPNAGEQIKEKSADYLNARYDAALEVLFTQKADVDKQKSDVALANQRKSANQPNKNDASDTQESARARMIERMKNGK